uniref:Uncharacterized protein n=1 Tax=Trichogramma kaykai TaxID=54128 RepID=A0ABD2WHG4_9HYME
MSRGVQARVVRRIRLIGESPPTYTSRFVYRAYYTTSTPRGAQCGNKVKLAIHLTVHYTVSAEIRYFVKYDTRGARPANVVLLKNTYFVNIDIIRYGLVARISGFHPEGSGSIPGIGNFFYQIFIFNSSKIVISEIS